MRLFGRTFPDPKNGFIEMELRELTSSEQTSSDAIRERARVSSKARHTRQYAVIENDQEVAFLSLDMVPGSEYLVLYEMFVLSDARQRGIGSQLLLAVENLARLLGYEKVALSPWPLEDTSAQADLINWYKGRGYRERPECLTELEKSVTTG